MRLFLVLLTNVVDSFTFGIGLFCIALVGIFVVRSNVIITLLSLELLLLSLNVQFIVFSVYLDDLLGQFISFIILTLAASESAIGLALLVVLYKMNGVISLNLFNNLKG